MSFRIGERVDDANRCSYCCKPAVIRYGCGAERLCAVHLISRIEAHVGRNIRENSLVIPGDHVAVALSGGKDSSALLLIMTRLLSEWQDVKLTALTIDEGIAGYRDETIAHAESLAKWAGVPHIVVSFRDLFGRDLDALLEKSNPWGRACTVCGVLRRKALAESARALGATKIATGHNRNDEAQTVLMNILQGNLYPLIRDSSSHETSALIPRIKPLDVLTEKEVVTYLFVRNFSLELPECPYATASLRSGVRDILDRWEFSHPGTIDALIHVRDTLRDPGVPGNAPEKLRSCRICKTSSNREICPACRILRSS